MVFSGLHDVLKSYQLKDRFSLSYLGGVLKPFLEFIQNRAVQFNHIRANVYVYIYIYLFLVSL